MSLDHMEVTADHPQLHSEFEAKLGYRRSCLKGGGGGSNSNSSNDFSDWIRDVEAATS